MIIEVVFVSLKRSRKPFKLNGILVPYNLAMAALNFYIFYRLEAASYRLNYSIFCEPCRQVSTPDEMQVSFASALNLNLESSIFFGVFASFSICA